MPAPKESYDELFERCQSIAPKGFEKDSWYIIVAATLITADGGEHLADLYTYLLAKLGPNSTQEDRRRVSRRLRAIIIKSWTLVGMPRASTGFFAFAKLEKPEDIDMSWDRSDYAADPAKAVKRTKEWWTQVFGEQEANRILDSYNTNPDFGWTVDFAVYGLFLADLTVLGPFENELVILSSVMGQGAHYTTTVHLKASRRLGFSAEDLKAAQAVIETVAQHEGKDTSSWPRAETYEHDFA